MGAVQALMSVVSTVILITHWDGANVRKAFEFSGNSAGVPMQMNHLNHCDDYGGYKCAECDAYVGAFNHFDHEGWFKHLDTIDWYENHLTLAVVQSSDLEFIKTWRPSGQA